MKHYGRARQAAFKIILASLLILGVLVGGGYFALGHLSVALTAVLVGIWALFAIFTFNFFRDPSANPPAGDHLVVAPAHGTVDVVDDASIKEFNGEKRKRISIFLNVFNVHVQQAPVTGKVTFLKHTPGKFLNAINADCADFNENVLLVFEPAAKPAEKIGVRLIAGLIARRIIPYVAMDDRVEKGERISLVQFGSRANVYFPMNYEIKVKIGDKVVGGETVIAERK